MNPVTRKEMFLNAVCDGNPCGLTPATREEMFLAALASGDTCGLEPASRHEVMLKKLDEAGGGSGGGGGTKIDVCAITFTTDGEEYHIHGPVADKDGNVVSIDTVVENGATYYLPSFSYVVVETCAMDMGNGVDFEVESDVVINQHFGNLITAYIFAEPGSTGTAALKSEMIW